MMRLMLILTIINILLENIQREQKEKLFYLFCYLTLSLNNRQLYILFRLQYCGCYWIESRQINQMRNQLNAVNKATEVKKIKGDANRMINNHLSILFRLLQLLFLRLKIKVNVVLKNIRISYHRVKDINYSKKHLNSKDLLYNDYNKV